MQCIYFGILHAVTLFLSTHSLMVFREYFDFNISSLLYTGLKWAGTSTVKS